MRKMQCAPIPGCTPIESQCVFYNGVYLPTLQITAGTNLNDILKKIDETIGGQGGIQSDWAETNPSSLSYIQNKPIFASVAYSGNYNDLINRPAPQNLQATTTIGNISNNAIFLTGANGIPTTGAAGLMIGYNGFEGVIGGIEPGVGFYKGISLIGGYLSGGFLVDTPSILTFVGDVNIHTGKKFTLTTQDPMEFRSIGASYASFIGGTTGSFLRVKGANATDLEDFITLGQGTQVAREALSQGSGIVYDSITGSITNSAPDQIVTISEGANITVTGTYPNFTIQAAGGSGGSVSSVGLSLPNIFNVTGSPVVSTGVLTGTLAIQATNTVFAGPASGGFDIPSFRSLVEADIPSLSTAKITSGVFSTARLGSGTANNTNFLRGDSTWQPITGFVPTTRSILSGTGLTGGGDLSVDRTLSVVFGTAVGTVAQGNDSRINNGQTAFGWGNHASAGYLTTTTGDARYPRLSVAYANPTWISTLDYNKLFNAPASLPTSSNLQVVTDNGAFTTNAITSPEFKSDGSQDVRISAPGSNHISFRTNGVEVGVFDASGALGVGTIPNSARGSLLEVAGNIWSEDAYILGTTSSPTAEFYMAGSNAGLRMMNTNDFLFARNASTEMARFKGTNGNLLINTTTDNTTHKLQVNGGIMGGNILANGEVRSIVGSINSILSADASTSVIGTTTNHATAFWTNGTERLRILANGNVGVGTTLPQQKFVVSNAGAEGIEFIPSLGVIEAYNRSAGARSPLLLAGSIQTFRTDDIERMRIDGSGNVGIGTTSPSEKLTVEGDIKANNGQIASTVAGITSIMSSDGTTGIVGTTTNHGLSFRTNNTQRAVIDNAGAVGIGTTTPAAGYKLDVAGLATLTGANTVMNMGEGNANLTFIQASNRAATVGKDLAFYSTTENMRITAAGNVSIGTGNPDPLATLSVHRAMDTMVVMGQTTPTSGNKRLAFRTGFSGLNITGEIYDGTNWIYDGVHITGLVQTDNLDVPGNATILNMDTDTGLINVATVGSLTTKTTLINTAIPFSITPDDHSIIIQGIGTGAGDGLLITLPDPATNEGRILVFFEYSSSTWATNYSITPISGPPVSTISGLQTIQVLNGDWRKI